MFKISQAPTEIKSQPSIHLSSCLWQELSETDQAIIQGGPGLPPGTFPPPGGLGGFINGGGGGSRNWDPPETS